MIHETENVIIPITDTMPLRGAATIHQVGFYLGVSASSVRRIANETPDFPQPKKLIRSLRWDAEEVIAWFKKQPRTSA